MTALTSSRLGLMLPTDSDPFTPADFSATFNILDGVPGITPIANLAALPVGLTASQHMSTYIQADTGAIWYWYRPSSGVGGVWKRANNIGVLGQSVLGSTVTTSVVGSAGAPSLFGAGVTVTAPGGRAIKASIFLEGVANNGSPNFQYGSSLWINGSQAVEITGFSTTLGNNASYEWYILAPTAGGSYNFNVRIYSWVGGTTLCNNATMTIVEV